MICISQLPGQDFTKPNISTFKDYTQCDVHVFRFIFVLSFLAHDHQHHSYSLRFALPLYICLQCSKCMVVKIKGLYSVLQLFHARKFSLYAQFVSHPYS